MSALESCIARARRRQFAVVVFAQGATALAIGLCGFILLLLAGSQILDWYWPLSLFLAAFSVGLYRTAKRIPSPYILAQQIDRRLKLHDTLSSARHFAASRPGIQAEMLRRLIHQAERAAYDVVLKEAFPFRATRSMYVSLILFVVAVGLFGVRYGVRHSFDPRHPLMSFSLEPFFAAEKQVPEKQKSPEQRRLEQQLAAVAMNVEPQQAPGDLGNAPDSVLETVDVPPEVMQDLPPDMPRPKENKITGISMGDKSGEGESGEDSDEGQTPGQGPENSKGTQAKNESGPQSAEQPGANSSLMDKMRDALANLMAKLKIEPKTGTQQTTSNRTQPNSPPQPGNAQKGSQQDGASQQGESQPSDGEGEQQGEGGEEAQGGQSKQSSESGEQQSSRDARTGMGKQDGNKDVQLAEQLEAMGKISEIFGKRAANMSGEVMVEVQANKQQSLRTPYSQRRATHTEAGGEIHRDEVPLIYQHYVQQYFEQIRRTAPAKAKGEGSARGANSP